MRSRAAAAILSEKGFSEVFNMSGGIRAWEGLVSTGAPDSGMAFFGATSGAEELVALAWLMEDGSMKFYAAAPEVIFDEDARKLFGSLVTAEEHHKKTLLDLFREVSGHDPLPDFPASVLSEGRSDLIGDVMEGGMRVSETLAWIMGKDLEAILELAIALEANAYDLYIRMERHLDDEQSKKVFSVLAAEEKTHLDRLASLMDRKA